MVFGRKGKLTVDSGELKDEIESLSNFLSSKLEVDVTSKGNKLFVNSDVLSTSELKRIVNKFVYRFHLNQKYGVELEDDTVKIIKFKSVKKMKKVKKGIIPSTTKHGW